MVRVWQTFGFPTSQPQEKSPASFDGLSDELPHAMNVAPPANNTAAAKEWISHDFMSRG
jgi:hypothetical protein